LGTDFLHTGLNNSEIRYKNYLFSWRGCMRTLRTLYVYRTVDTAPSCFFSCRPVQYLTFLLCMGLHDASRKFEKTWSQSLSWQPVFSASQFGLTYVFCGDGNLGCEAGWHSKATF